MWLFHCRMAVTACADENHMQCHDCMWFLSLYVPVCVWMVLWKLKLSGLWSKLSGHDNNRLWQGTALIRRDDTLNAYWYVCMCVCVCFLNEDIQEMDHMKSCVGLLQRKDLLLCWNILNGYQAGCSTVYSSLESCKSVSFGNHRVYIL